MSQGDRWMLPDGVEELLPPRAAAMERLRRELLDLFAVWGYDMVTPPLIEYLDSLLTGTGNDLDLQTFKLTDQLSGRLMGVRADMTPQVARIDAHRMSGEGVRRLCYVGTVVHTRPGSFSGSRCPHQAGAELFGYPGLDADLEIIGLMLATLETAGVNGLHLDLGHVNIYRQLIAAADLAPETEARLFDIMQRKAVPELEQFLAEGAVAEALAPALWALPDLSGGREVLERARSALAPGGEDVMAALDELERACVWLEGQYPQLPLHLDLAELRGFRYHTGLVFTAFQPGHGEPLARGGRYDHIGEVFGRRRPATGFSTDLQNLLLLASRAGESPVKAVFAPAENDPELLRVIAELRSRGERVLCQLPGEDAEVLLAACDRRLVREGDKWQVGPVNQ